MMNESVRVRWQTVSKPLPTAAVAKPSVAARPAQLAHSMLPT